MTKSRSRTTSEQQVAPTNPAFVTQPVQDIANQINALSNRDPLDFVTGASDLQQQAFSSASGLVNGGSDSAGGLFDQSRDLAVSAGSAGANTAQGGLLGSPNSTQAASVDSASFQASLVGDNGIQVGPTARVSSQSLLDGLDNYISPYTDQVVDTSLAEYDEQSGRNRARLAAEGAANNAFGGSRFAVREGIFEGETDRLRALTEAGLRDQAFNTGANLSSQDADRRQQASSANAAADNARTAQQAQLDQQSLLSDVAAQNQAGQFNAGLEQQGLLADAGFQQQANIANQNAANDFALNQFASDNQFSQFNASQEEQALLRQLQASSQLGDLGAAQGADERANIGLLAGLGEQQRDIERSANTADLELLRAQTQLLGGLPLGLFQGQTSTGTSETTKSGSLLDTVTGGLGLVSKFF